MLGRSVQRASLFDARPVAGDDRPHRQQVFALAVAEEADDLLRAPFAVFGTPAQLALIEVDDQLRHLLPHFPQRFDQVAPRGTEASGAV